MEKFKEWRCFHCDEIFTTRREAALHFGADEFEEPACKIKMGAERSILEALRREQRSNRELTHLLHDENSEAYRILADYHSRQAQAVEAAENLGYERGLRDGRGEQSD